MPGFLFLFMLIRHNLNGHKSTWMKYHTTSNTLNKRHNPESQKPPRVTDCSSSKGNVIFRPVSKHPWSPVYFELYMNEYVLLCIELLALTFVLFLFCVCMHVGAHVPSCGGTRHQKTTCRNWFSPPTVQVPGMELRSLALWVGTFTHWAVLPVLNILSLWDTNMLFMYQQFVHFRSV